MARGAKVLTPSAAFGEAGAPEIERGGVAAETLRLALQRGQLVHRLLQTLPDIPPTQRADAARRFLARVKPAIDPAAGEAMMTETSAVLADAAFAPLFAVGSRAEVPIAGRITLTGGKLVAVSGQIDRLAVSATTVLIADFKTDRNPPRHVEGIAPGYRRQLALYRAVLTRLYPRHEIRAAVVFTQAPHLLELPAALLDTSLADLATGRLDPPEEHT